MEPIMDYLKRKLGAVEPSLWETVAAEAGVAKTLPRKLVYDSTRDNPRIATIQPLIDYFQDVERGVRDLPTEKARA